MYDQSFSKFSIEEMLKHSDFYRQKNLKVEKDNLVAEAYEISQKGFLAAPAVTTKTIAGTSKKIYSLKNFSDQLLIRKISANLSRVSTARPQDRDSIIQNLKRLLAECVTYKIYRKDIKDFYDTLAPSTILSQLELDWSLSRPTIRLTRSLLDHFKASGGLPRGLQVSAILSEYALQSFDEFVNKHPEVFFYARFVDDLLIITSGDEDEADFEKKLSEHLPTTLEFSPKISKNYKKMVPKVRSNKGPPKEEAKFNYLGYAITVYNPTTKGKFRSVPRHIHFDISENKIKKYKTRIMKALLAYLGNHDFELLYARIKMLTGNYYIFDRDHHVKRTAGIYYSYKYSDADIYDPQSAVSQLDRFFRNILLSGKGTISHDLQINLTKAQIRKLLGQTFRNGFDKKVFHHFNETKMRWLTSCWNNG